MRLPLSLLLIVGSGLCILPFSGEAGGATDFCARGGPESVLPCLASAYEARDADAYERLLGPDYQFTFTKKKVSWGREKDVAQTRMVFGSPEVQAINFVIEGEPRITPGKEADTWTVDGVTCLLRVHLSKTAFPLEVRSLNNVWIVQKVDSPEPHYVIREWQDHGE
jgi:hypothetical protein